MGQRSYYERLKRLAREKRDVYGVCTDALGLRKMRAIYKAEGIKIDLWGQLRKVRAAYMVVDGEPHVLLNKAMKPVEPRLFSLAHELKHHYVDQDVAHQSLLGCQEYVSYTNVPEIEIGAEVFAAEFIFPEAEFREWASPHLRSKPCTSEDVVRLKRICRAKVSYRFLTKRLERLGFTEPGAFIGVQFKKLEEKIFGVPFYKQLRRRR